VARRAPRLRGSDGGGLRLLRLVIDRSIGRRPW
jgi:hypothetical protein